MSRVIDQYDRIGSSASDFNNGSDKHFIGNGPGGGGGDSFGGGSSGSDFGSGFLGSTYGLVGALGSSTPFDLGGVYMDKALSIIGENINDIHGVSYDPLTGQIIMLSNTGASVPEIPVDYFLAALKAVYSNQTTSPGVSIDPAKDDAGNWDFTKDQTVRFLGGIENTALGKAVYDSDLLMKLIGLGSDNITGTSIRPNGENISESYIDQHVPGFKDMFSLSADVADPSILNGLARLRFWFVPKEMKLVKSDSGDAFVFDTSSVQLKTQTMFSSTGVEDPRALAYVQFFNDHFTQLASLYPEFAELEKGMRAVGLAKFIKDNNIPVDLSWLSKANVTPVTTPTTTPVASATKIVTVHGTGQEVTMTFQGGVDYGLFEGQNFQYLLDSDALVSGLRDAAESSRLSDTTQTWSVEMNGTTYQASAFSLAPTKKDGNFSWGGTDLSYGTSGGLPLTWQRYYDSFASGNETSMGNGWGYTPYGLHFPVEKNTSQITINEIISTVDIYPSVYLSVGSGAMLFKPTGFQSDGGVLYSSEDQKTGSQILIGNHDGTFTLVSGGDNLNFASDGRITSIVDNNQNTIEYIYDANNRLIRIDDKSSNLSIAATYDVSGRLSKVTGSDSRSVSYTYDTVKNDLIKVTQDWSGRYVSMAYDSDHRMTSATDDMGRSLFENTYDIMGRLTSRTDSLGTEVGSQSNLLTQNTQYTNQTTGANSGFTYDNLFRVTGQTNTLGSQTQYNYADGSFNVQSIIDAMGNSTSFEYDSYGNITSATDSLGNKTRVYYRTVSLGMSRPIYVEMPNGLGTYCEYDASGNVISVTEGVRVRSINPDGSLTVTLTDRKTTYDYDTKGRVSKVTDPTSRTIEYSYDDAGNVMEVKDSLENTQSTEYVTRNGVTTGLVSKVSDILGRAVTYGYDAVRDLVTSVTTALGTVTYAYDTIDRQTSVTDAEGRKTEFVYNDNNQLIGVVEAGNTATTVDDILANFTYTALGQLYNISGPIGAITKFAYDVAGRLVNLLIGENAKNYAEGQSVNVSEVGEDDVHLALNVDSNTSQVKILYKKTSDSTYQLSQAYNLTPGDNSINLLGLSGNTTYTYQIQYIDKEGDVSYSRKHDFKTNSPELPAILNTTVQSTSDTTASIKIDVSKDIRDAQITYNVHGETFNKTIFTQSVGNAKSDGLIFSMENLRSGQDYDAVISITDRFGVTSEITAVSFKTTGSLSADDSALRATQPFGQTIATLQTKAYISLEGSTLSDSLAESYLIDLRDFQGNAITNCTLTLVTNPLLGKALRISDLTSNSEYTYTLIVTSRGDISPISGSFHTPTSGDTSLPQNSTLHLSADPKNIRLGLRLSETLKALIITATDQVTQAIKKYYFFDIAPNIVTIFLLDGLESGRQYAINWLMLDMSGNYNQQSFNTYTSALDEIAPTITQSSITDISATSFTLHLTTSELLSKIRVRYRIIGDTQWIEQLLTPSSLAIDMNISNLLSGQSYEYQYTLEDNSGNQLLTGWVGV